MHRSKFTAAMVAICLAFTSNLALSQSSAYPAKAIRLVVPFTPGSASDVLARTIGERLSASWQQPVTIDNRPGAGGVIATGQVAKANPDGYTLIVVSAGHVVNPWLYGNLPYDTLKDFQGVIPLASLPSVLVVSPELGVGSLKELVALSKAKPGALNYASGGIGSASHVSAEKFISAAGLDVTHVPLKGAPDMVTETIGGRTQFGFLPITAALPALKGGRLKALAVSSRNRSNVLPDTPTVGESGFSAAEFNFWIALLAPAKTPTEIVTKLNNEITRIYQTPEMREKLSLLGAEQMPMNPTALNQFMQEEYTALAPVFKSAPSAK